jgi:hydroxypyruvate isomerase
MHFMSGKLSGQENSPGVIYTLERNLLSIVGELEKRQIVGLIEPINNRTVPGYVLNNFETGGFL